MQPHYHRCEACGAPISCSGRQDRYTGYEGIPPVCEFEFLLDEILCEECWDRPRCAQCNRRIGYDRGFCLPVLSQIAYFCSYPCFTAMLKEDETFATAVLGTGANHGTDEAVTPSSL